LIFAAALRVGEILLAIIGILTAAVSIFYYLRVVTTLYLYRATGDGTQEGANIFEILVLGLSAALIALFGLFPAPLLDLLKSQLS
jgi:NADH-quinone oxidoreductase subunit N